MYHIVYKTIHIESGKYYIGVHSTNNLSDTYLGSGKYLKRAIKLYGSSAFKRIILQICNTKQDAFDIERSIVTE